MKRIKPAFLVFLVSLIFVSSFAAAPTPPEPMKSQAVTADDGPPPPPPKDTPIDANVILLLLGGLTLGMSVIYRNKTKKALI